MHACTPHPIQLIHANCFPFVPFLFYSFNFHISPFAHFLITTIIHEMEFVTFFFFTYSSHSIRSQMCEWRNWFLIIWFANATEMNGKGRDSSHWSNVLSHQQEIYYRCWSIVFFSLLGESMTNRRNTTDIARKKWRQSKKRYWKTHRTNVKM